MIIDLVDVVHATPSAVSSEDYALLREDAIASGSQNPVRMDRVRAARAKMANGDYDKPEVIDDLVDRLLADLK